MIARREWILLLGLLGLLIALTVLTVQGQPDDETDTLTGSTYANGRGGARAFYLWLEALDYEVERYEPGEFTLERVDGVFWLISPLEFVTEEDAVALRDWVEDGGILVVADATIFTLDDAFGLEDGDANGTDSTLYPTVPWLKTGEGRYRSWERYELPEGATPLLADAEGAVGAFFMPYGNGQFWTFPTSQPFTNLALRDANESAFVESLLAQLPSDSTHYFDEYHHGFGSNFALNLDRGLLYQMVRTPWGWGILYAVGIGAMWLILRGRRFGRAIPLPNEHLRREAGEYVQGLAWLYRRARLRAPIQRHYHQGLKRSVTQRYRLPLTQDDSAFLSALARVRPDVDIQGLARHLRALQSRVNNERQLQALAEAHQMWVQKLVG
jgi:hypothetical protein